MIERKRTQEVIVGGVTLGGSAPVRVQSMTKTDTRDAGATIQQIHQLELAGCEFVRVAVPDENAARRLTEIKRSISIPLISDIHFDYRLALLSLEAGVDKVRVNPGTIGARWKYETVIEACREQNVPMRIGLNSGSVEKKFLKQYQRPTTDAILASLENAITTCERKHFKKIVISAKTPDPCTLIEVNEKIAERFSYPIHLGVTESGLPFSGAIRSTTALAVLLFNGIGDTVRVSLTGSPVLEVEAAYEILKSLGLRTHGPVLISCPICGRCEIDLLKIAEGLKDRLSVLGDSVSGLKIAVMGCVVNGPGEAREADFGIAGGKGYGVIFKGGKVLRKVKESFLIDELVSEIEKATR